MPNRSHWWKSISNTGIDRESTWRLLFDLFSLEMKRTVRFAADVQVHVIDGEENRRGVWEQYARDRER